ncbi:MAG: hypothetical protein ACKO1J_11025 [Tagaea sp.]
MSENAIGRMPVLEPVDEADRQKIFHAVESLDVKTLQRLGVWEVIEKAVPEPTLMYVDAEVEGIYFDPKSRHYVILADISVKSDLGDYIESLPTTISAHNAEEGGIVIDGVSVNLPESAPNRLPHP